MFQSKIKKVFVVGKIVGPTVIPSMAIAEEYDLARIVKRDLLCRFQDLV
jgi:hypothetical protein